MDLASLLGLLLAIFSLLFSEIITGGSLAALLNISAFILIVGGTIGSTMISYSMKEIMQLPSFLVKAFKNSEPNFNNIIDEIVRYAEIARKEGLLSLESKASASSDKFIAHGLMLVSDAVETDYMELILSSEIAKRQRHERLGAEIMGTAGGYSPTMGIIGTVMGLVHVLGNISNTDELAASIAVAFLATFYGIGIANLFWLPLSGKLNRLAKQQKLADEIILEGLIAIAEGKSPKLIEEQLKSMALSEDMAQARDRETIVSAQGSD